MGHAPWWVGAPHGKSPLSKFDGHSFHFGGGNMMFLGIEG